MRHPPGRSHRISIRWAYSSVPGEMFAGDSVPYHYPAKPAYPHARSSPPSWTAPGGCPALRGRPRRPAPRGRPRPLLAPLARVRREVGREAGRRPVPAAAAPAGGRDAQRLRRLGPRRAARPGARRRRAGRPRAGSRRLQRADLRRGGARRRRAAARARRLPARHGQHARALPPGRGDRRGRGSHRTDARRSRGRRRHLDPDD